MLRPTCWGRVWAQLLKQLVINSEKLEYILTSEAASQSHPAFHNGHFSFEGVTDPILLLRFNTESKGKWGRRKKNWRWKNVLLLKEPINSRCLVSITLAFEVPIRASRVPKNQLQSEYRNSSLSLLFIQYKKVTNITATTNQNYQQP
jgi:hypothetical protein